MKKSQSKNRGASSVDFCISFMFLFVCVLIVIEFAFFAVGGEVMSYAAYMGARSLKVNDDANVVKVVKKISPWVDSGSIQKETGSSSAAVLIDSETAPVLGKRAAFSILNGGLRKKIFSGVALTRPERKICEDNPLWYQAGEAACE